ncbi:MAG: bifunctional folylpolyglutamate synthase/dihydrofolate synthase [Acidobacteria bacterium]|nr:bifunctional folylpolyglutamate synthase/dihydrofolate synthase [Acidobacteriota bacterium]
MAYLDSLIGRGLRPGLERLRTILEVAGHPERSVPSVLVAGTNGKGSTAATLTAIAHAAGYNTGLYTSPHLVELEERWRIREAPVDHDVLIAAVRSLQESALEAGLTPTYFEALTLLAFFIFERSRCDLAILEVGMGGRLDATNVVDPLASVITRIDYDHQEWLGNTIEEITREKLGITRRATPLVVSEQPPQVIDLMRRWCDELGCPLHVVPDEVTIESLETSLTGSSATIRTPSAQYELRSPLVGQHQLSNLTSAVRAAELLSSTFRAIDAAAVLEGTAHTVWRGRLELFDIGGRLVVVDGAHNPAGTRSAAQFVRTLPGPRALVFGALSDKDVASMLESLVGLFDHVIFTTPDSERSIPAASLAELHHPDARVIPTDVDAIRAALARPGIATVVICGSLYLAGSAIRLLDTMAAPRA